MAIMTATNISNKLMLSSMPICGNREFISKVVIIRNKNFKYKRASKSKLEYFVKNLSYVLGMDDEVSLLVLHTELDVLLSFNRIIRESVEILKARGDEKIEVEQEDDFYIFREFALFSLRINYVS